MDVTVPALGESILEGVIAKWLKKVGEPIAVDEPIADLETDKISVQIPAPVKGVLAEQKFAEGTTVRVGQVIAVISETAVAAAPPAAAPAPAPTNVAQVVAAVAQVAASVQAPQLTAVPAPVAPPAPRPANGDAGHHALPAHAPSPTERQRARELGTDVAQLRASVAPAAAAPAPAAEPTAPPVAGDREEVVAMSPLRKRVAERLVAAQHTAAVLTTFNEVDMTNLLALRARHQDAFVAKHGTKLGFMSFFTRAVIAALKEFPVLNAEIHGTHILYKKHYDIGIAVGSGRGLVVPVLRNADALDFAGIEKGIAALAAKVKDNKLTLDDLSGGTFTITNGGIYGSMMSTPLLNLPQTGILGMHNIIRRPVAVPGKTGDEIAIRPMMYVALSYDHRLVDGREAVQFLVGVKERVENPEKLLFSL
jgi:2-oxoglutarate dehydrogenase E2 component (dihydrolipoamide succinyltransferase)